MGHQFVSASGRTQKEAQADLMYRSKHADEYHHGLNGVKWHDRVFTDYNEMTHYIEEKSNDLYFSGLGVGVVYKKALIKPTTTLKNLEDTVRRARQELNSFESVVHYKVRTKQQTVSCRHCGTKYKTINLMRNTCSKCGKDMRPSSILEKSANLKKKLQVAERKYKAKLTEMQNRSKTETHYYCGGWVHC